MKKTALTVIVLSTLYLVVSASVHAQDFSAQKAYQDYLFQQSNYKKANAEYEDAKTFYQNNPTLQLREEARKKTLALLKNRDQLLTVYLTALRMQIVESTGFTADEKGVIFAKIDPEVAWYQSHVAAYQDGDDLNTLFSKSDESKSRYQTTTKPIVFNSLFDITLSQQIGLRVDHQVVYTGIKGYINNQVSLGKLRIDPFNRWLNDTDNVLQILSQNETLAKGEMDSFYSRSVKLEGTYEENVELLANSVNPLNRLNNYLSEMLTYLESQ